MAKSRNDVKGRDMETELFWIAVAAPFLLVILGLLIWSLVWAYRDAEKRGKPGLLVVLLVFLLNWPISLLAWIVFRPESIQEQLKA
jgi:hypothetical protein